MSSTLVLLRGVNEKWKQMGNWFSDKFHFLSFMNFWIELIEYFGWSNAMQQILGSPYTLKSSFFNSEAKVFVAKNKLNCYRFALEAHFYDILLRLISSC